MVSTGKDTVVLTPEELLDCLGRISNTRITYKWLNDKKLCFEVFTTDKKSEHVAKIAHIIEHYILHEKGIECEFKVTARLELHDEDEEEDDGTIVSSPHFMPNKTINRLIMIFQSPEEDLRVFRFEAGEGILKGHQYYDADPNIVEIECNSIQKSIQICAKSSKTNMFNVFEVNSNCLGNKKFKDRYVRAFSRIPKEIRTHSVISLVRINPKFKKEDFEKRIAFVRSLAKRVFLSLSIDTFFERQSFYNTLPVDGFVLTVGVREMNRQDKTMKIQALTLDKTLNKSFVYLFYDPYQKTLPLVNGTKEVLYLNKFET